MQIVRNISDKLYRARRRLATAGVVALACMMAFHAVMGANGIFVYQKKKAEYRNLEKEIQSLQQENERLNQRIHALKTDPKAIEKEAREQLRYARPGEVVFALPEAQSKQNAPATAQK